MPPCAAQQRTPDRALASSLSAEDFWCSSILIQRERLPIGTFALDTGRLPQATIELTPDLPRSSRITAQALSASFRRRRLAALKAAQDDSAIYKAKRANSAAPYARPNRCALHCRQACLVTGLRRATSAGCAMCRIRNMMPALALREVQPASPTGPTRPCGTFIDLENIPVSLLYDRGYASIGCDPCTRPIRFDSTARRRWWWEAAVSAPPPNVAST